MKRKKAPALRQYGSPIETDMRNALCAQACVASWNVELFDYSTSPDTPLVNVHNGRVTQVSGEEMNVDPRYSNWGHGEDEWSLFGGVMIDSYKADFILVAGAQDDCFIAIECDGHEWHDRTKQQASADRARDRRLLMFGVHTLRFTGSDIHHRADECAREIFELAKALQKRGVFDAWSDGHDLGYRSGREAGQRYHAALMAAHGAYAGILSGVG